MPRSSRFLGPGRGPAPARRFRSRLATGTSPVVTPPPTPVTPLSDAIASADQTIVATLLADWDRDGYSNPLSDLMPAASSITVETSATGSLPIEAGLVEGFASAQLTATLDGTLADGVTQAVDALAPYRSDSALFRKALLTAPVACDMGLNTAVGPSYVPQFTGQVRSIRVDSGSRSAELVAADPAELLRVPVTLPAHAMARTDWTSSNHKFYIRPQAIIDFVLRKNGIYPSPPAHPQAQISCTGHGWLAAEAGRSAVPRGIAAIIADDAWWTDGPFGMLAVRGVFQVSAAYQEFFSREQYTPVAGNGIGIAAWVRVGNDMGLPVALTPMFQLFPLVDTSLKIEMGFYGDGNFSGTINGAGFGQPISTPSQWMYVGLHFRHNVGGTTTITFRQNGATSSGDVATPVTTAAVSPFLQCTAWTISRDWSNFQVWYDPNPPVTWPGETHTPQASIDVGLNLMTHLPDAINVDSWQLIKDVAGAEYGLAGFDNTGRFFFRDRNHATDPTSVEKTANADTSLLSLATLSSIDAVRNTVTVETASSFMIFGGSIISAIDANEFTSPAGTTVFAVPLEYGAIGTTTQTIPHIPSASWTDIFTWGFTAVRDDSPATEVTSGVTVIFIMASDRLGWVVVYNTSGFTVRFATTTGTPALRVAGWALTSEPTVFQEVIDLGSISVYGERSLSIDASPYRQVLAPLGVVAQSLLDFLKNPIPVLEDIVINGDPRLALGDTVRLVDLNTNGTTLASVVKIIRRLAGGQLTDTLTVRPVAPP